MKTIKLELEIPKVNFILGALGDMLAKTGAWVLMGKIKEQEKPQVSEELQIKKKE